ncbi:MAG: dTDP-glucose 4,6-dehydratase [Planctomycetota bacterium]|jgi:dTDP-glucose 4,6-dehydratase
MTHSFEHVLVTGGAGFIGSNFIRFLLERRPGVRVTNYDALTYAGNLVSLEDVADDPRYRFVRGDIRDRDAMGDALAECDAVVHFAAESHVDRSIVDSGPFVSTNVVGTQVLLDACVQHGGIRRFVHIGTDEVYGELPLDRPDLKFTERTPLQPNSPYSASKTASDLLALAYRHTFGLPVMVTRCSNNFGPYQFPEKVIPLFVTNLIDGQKVPLYGDGLNVRDWLHVLDHCEAVLTVLEGGTVGEVYNVGGNNERSNIELTRAILELFDAGEEMIQRVPDRLGHDRRYAIDASKIERELGWAPSRSAWPAALRDTVAWYRAHEAWWRPLKERVAAG